MGHSGAGRALHRLPADRQRRDAEPRADRRRHQQQQGVGVSLEQRRHLRRDLHRGSVAGQPYARCPYGRRPRQGGSRLGRQQLRRAEVWRVASDGRERHAAIRIDDAAARLWRVGGQLAQRPSSQGGRLPDPRHHDEHEDRGVGRMSTDHLLAHPDDAALSWTASRVRFVTTGQTVTTDTSVVLPGLTGEIRLGRNGWSGADPTAPQHQRRITYWPHDNFSDTEMENLVL